MAGSLTQFNGMGTLPGEDSIPVITRPNPFRIGLIALGLAFAALPSTAAASATTCFGIAATIVGTTGDDVLIGTNDADVIHGLGGDDVIRGKEGDDILCGGPGNDVLLGWSGDDRISGGTGDDLVRGGVGNDTLVGRAGKDTLYGDPGNDVLRGGDGSDTLVGRAGDDTLYGDPGNDVLRGGDGNDEIWGGGGADDLWGGAGDDLLMGNRGADELAGGPHADDLDGGRDDDVLWEFRRNDTHLADGTPDAEGDVFAYSRIEVTPEGGWVLWQPAVGQLVQGHEGVLTITNLPDGLLMIERIDPERYLLGIAEMPYSWGAAALQSQVIAARTYLANLVSNPRYGPMATYGFDICDWSLCQVYKGTKYGWLEPWEDAVVATEGRILLYNGSPAATFYHSTSGLTTRSIQDVWTSAAPLSYLQAVEVPPQDSVFATWWYRLPLDAFMDILAHDGITFDGQIESIRTIVTLPGEGPYRVRIRSTEETREFPIETMQRALNRHAIDLYPQYVPSLNKAVGQAALSPTFTVRLRADGRVAINGQGWGHQIGLSQYGAKALAELGSTVDEILNHFYTGLFPEDDPGLIPGLVDVGLFYENGDQAIVLRPEAGYTLRNAGGVVKTGTGATITITRHGDDAIAVSIEE